MTPKFRPGDIVVRVSTKDNSYKVYCTIISCDAGFYTYIRNFGQSSVDIVRLSIELFENGSNWFSDARYLTQEEKIELL